MAASDDFYLELIEEIVPIIEEFGTEYQVRPVAGQFDPSTLKAGAPGASRIVKGLVDTAQSQFNLASQIYAVTASAAIKLGKKSLILLPDANPKTNEEINVDGQWFNLGKVEPVKPADVVVLYMLDITK